MKLQPVSQDELTVTDPPVMVWVRVQDAIGLLWDKNPKLHDLGAIAESIHKHGFQELPKYDATLPGIKSGNGRTEAVAWMEKDGRYDVPRGVAVDRDGHWVIPILVGTDAASVELAVSYAVDANNLTLLGGDFTSIDALRVWHTQGYLDILTFLAERDALPVSVDQDDYAILVHGAAFTPGQFESSGDEEEVKPEVVIELGLENNSAEIEALQAIRKLIDANPHWQGRIR